MKRLQSKKIKLASRQTTEESGNANENRKKINAVY